MMSILEYSEDMGIKVEKVRELCEKLGIAYKNEETVLSEDEIILLDNEIERESGSEEDIETDDLKDDYEDYEEVEEEEEVSSKKTYPKNKEMLDNQNPRFYQKERKNMYKNKKKLMSNKDEISSDVVVYKEGMTVKDLADALNLSSANFIKKLMSLGVMSNLNTVIDFDTAEMLVEDEGKVIKREETLDISNFEEFEIQDNPEDLENRPPVVTIMGHVDHGKTSLLDYIRKSSVAEGEAGGITQAIGAYQAEVNGKKITFIDTPGHEAFTEMRARGAQVTDIVIIIVAADDGVKPQTLEAIDHAKAANVPIIVAINKMDKEGANPDRVMEEMASHGLQPEEWGGDVIFNKISAHTGDGINELLENILLVAEMADLKANPNRYATGTIIESKLDPHKGALATVLVQNGTLRLGDPLVAGIFYGKVRTLKNSQGENITKATPGMPVSITGLAGVPDAGEKFMAFETEKQAKSIAAKRSEKSRMENINKTGISLDELFKKAKASDKELRIVLKADNKGSLEAIKDSLNKIDIEGVRCNVIRGGVGTITESDITLASASSAFVVGFNVRPQNVVRDYAKENNVEIKLYDVIYKMIEDIEDGIKGMLSPEFEEKITGSAEIRQIFKFSKVGNIAGCNVIDGVVKASSKARLIRDGVVVYTGEVQTLREGTKSVKEMTKGRDCGITLDNFQDIKEGDIIECFEMVEVKR